MAKQITKPEVKRDVFTSACKSQLGYDVVKEYQFHDKRKWRFDYAILDKKIAIEVEGGVWIQGRHTRPKGFLGDMEKYNTAAQMGWKLLRITPDKLMSLETFEMIIKAYEYE
jgi:very-short-patch-repair endonuclease